MHSFAPVFEHTAAWASNGSVISIVCVSHHWSRYVKQFRDDPQDISKPLNNTCPSESRAGLASTFTIFFRCFKVSCSVSNQRLKTAGVLMLADWRTPK